MGTYPLKSNLVCKACDSQEIRILCTIEGVPVHSVKLERSRSAALDLPRGNIRLGFCESCGFIFNTAYDPSSHNYYSDRYESTQACSTTFNEFHRRLAVSLIDRFDLRGKTIIEIGCGQGEFLSLLCELGSNRGIGFDPAYIEQKLSHEPFGDLTFIKDFYSEKYANYSSDFVCCKMTLEHIHNPKDFISMVRRSVGSRRETVVFFQVPDVTRILRDIAFWDIYYEHCSYFSPESIVSLFQHCGFDILNVNTEYDNQYLMIAAVPGRSSEEIDKNRNENINLLKKDVDFFINNYQNKLDGWKIKLNELKDSGSKPVIWGGGSKGVAFLTTLGVEDEIAYAVDINPRKHGTYLAGSGHMVVGPQYLKEYHPDVILVMNPVYTNEIRVTLQELGVHAELIPVG
jgi:SAM-dependent methyltransferase